MSEPHVIDLGDDDGTAVFRLGGAEIPVDVIRVNNQIADIQSAGRPAADELDAVCDLVEKLGFPRPSHRKANQFIAAVVAHKRALLGKDGPAQAPSGSPA